MRTRSFGLTALAFTTVMVALHAQMGAIALILTGSAFTALGSMTGAATLVLGAGYLGLTFAAYTVAVGTWMRRPWAWAGGVVVYASIAVATVILVLMSGKLIGAPLPLLATATGFWLLTRPAIKAEIMGASAAASDEVTSETMKATEPAR